MPAYRISIALDRSGSGDYLVSVHSEGAGAPKVASALSARHARRVARDLMDLIRARDGASAFVVEFRAPRL